MKCKDCNKNILKHLTRCKACKKKKQYENLLRWREKNPDYNKEYQVEYRKKRFLEYRKTIKPYIPPPRDSYEIDWSRRLNASIILVDERGIIMGFSSY